MFSDIHERKYWCWGTNCPGLGIDSEEVFEIIKTKILIFWLFNYYLLLFSAIDIAKKIRKEFPNKLTILGGSHAIVDSENTVKNYGYFDLVCYGKDGEYIIHDIVKKFNTKNCERNLFLEDFELVKSIKGIVFKSNNEIIKTAPADVIKDLDVLPIPARDLFPNERYMPLPNQYKTTRNQYGRY